MTKDYKVEKIFHVPIYSCIIENLDEVTNELDECIKKIEFKGVNDWGRTHLLSNINFDEDIIRKYQLNKLWSEIDKNLHTYCDDINFTMTDYYMKSWFSLFEKNNYAHVHNHSGSDISGVFYHKTNGNDGNIVFHNFNPYFNMSRCYSNYFQSWEHKPVVGKLLFFPSWLHHGVTTNETDDTRISFSFNINFT